MRRRRGRARLAPAEQAVSVPMDGPSPEEQVVARDLEQAALEVLGTLSEADRTTLRATVLGETHHGMISGATFRKRRERAFARLRQAWRRLYET